MRPFLLSFLILFVSFCQAQNIGIGTTTPDPSAILDVKSTSKGLLVPRLTLAQRNTMPSLTAGLLIYQTDNTPGFYFYNGSTWVQLSTGSATNYWSPNGTHVYNNNAGYIGIGNNSPDYKLSIFNNIVESNNNSSLLKLSGRNPVLAITDENYNGFGYLKAWTNGANGGFTNGMVVGAFPGYPIFLSTNYGPAMTVAGNNLVGIGTTTPTSPLSFGNITGTKISLWNAGPNNDFGIGLNSGEMQFYTAGQDHISFGYGNTNAFNESMRYYTGAGQLSIGTTVPAGRLHIANDLEAIRITGNQSFISFYNGANYKGYLWNKGANDMELGTAGVNTTGNLYLSIKGTPAISILNDGGVTVGDNSHGNAVSQMTVYSGIKLISTYIGLGTGDRWEISPHSSVLYFYKNGGFKAYIADDGSYNVASDYRLKEDFLPYKKVLKDIMHLNVLTYYYKERKVNTRSLGLIAQNVAGYFPEIVSKSYSKDGIQYLGLDYSKIGVLALKAVQEQQAIIEQQQKQIDNLEKRLAVLERLLNH